MLKNSKRGACIVIGLLLGLISIHPLYSVNAQDTSSFFPHDPIQIYSDSNFTFENGVTNGDGSIENPWIIENLSITNTSYVYANGGVGYYCIFIQDTSDYFIIRNCYISNINSISGLHLYNVSNCIIENNKIENMNRGIRFYNSENIIIKNNTVQGHKEAGISLTYLTDSIITNNTIQNNQICGLCLGYSTNIIIDNNLIQNNQKYGVTFSDINSTRICNNTFISNQYADVYVDVLNNKTLILDENNFNNGISIDGAEPYIPGNPPPPSNQIYVWMAIMIIVTIISLVFLWHKKSKLKEEDRNLERKDDETHLK